MSETWHITVLRKRDNVIKIRVAKNDPAGADPSITKPFLMRVFADFAYYADDSANLSGLSYMSRRLGPDNRLGDTAEAKTTSREAILKFDIIERKKDAFTYSITFTDPKWIEGIELETEWESSAY